MRVHYYHIPKTAGTAINFAFFNLSGSNSSEVYEQLNRAPKRIVEISDYRFIRDAKDLTQVGDFNYSFSHYPAYSISLPVDTYQFTCVRHPGDRVLSVYRALNMIRERGEKRPGLKWIGSTFEDFLKRIPRKELLGDIHMFSPNGNPKEAADSCINQCDRIILYEKIHEQVDLLRRDLDLPLELREVNASNYHVQENLDMDLLVRKIGPSMDFYKRIREYLDA